MGGKWLFNDSPVLRFTVCLIRKKRSNGVSVGADANGVGSDRRGVGVDANAVGSDRRDDGGNGGDDASGKAESAQKLPRLTVVLPTPQIKRRLTRTEVASDNYDKALSARALMCLHPHNKCRRCAARVVFKGQKFEVFINVTILVSCLLLTLQAPPLDTYWWALSFFLADVVLTLVFVFELVLRVLASGLVCSRYAYLRDGWNILDFIVVLLSIADLGTALHYFITVTLTVPVGTDPSEAGPAVDIGFLKVTRALRALRGLRLLHKSANMKTVVETLLRSFNSIGVGV